METKQHLVLRYVIMIQFLQVIEIMTSLKWCEDTERVNS